MEAEVRLFTCVLVSARMASGTKPTLQSDDIVFCYTHAHTHTNTHPGSMRSSFRPFVSMPESYIALAKILFNHSEVYAQNICSLASIKPCQRRFSVFQDGSRMGLVDETLSPNDIYCL